MGKDGRISEEQQRLVDGMFIEAVNSRDQARIALCLSKGANVHQRDHLGRTALMIAVVHYPGDKAFIQKMIDFGIDPFVKDNEGCTVFDRAKCLHDLWRAEVLDILLKSLPDAKIVDAPQGKKQDEKTDVSTREAIEVAPPLAFKPRQKKGDRFDL
jgi:hypothetical protein